MQNLTVEKRSRILVSKKKITKINLWISLLKKNKYHIRKTTTTTTTTTESRFQIKREPHFRKKNISSGKKVEPYFRK